MRQLVPKFVIALLLAAICALVLPSRVVHQVVGDVLARILPAGPRAIVELDEDGVPIVDYGNWHGVHIGRQRNPVTISQRAMAYHDLYQNGDQSYLQPFLNCANWLQSAAVPHGEFSLLEYQFPWPPYQLTPPWRSAMAQGRALQVLVRAHQLTNDGCYLETARQLLNAFFVDVQDGGVTLRSEENGWWYEEYTGDGVGESRVLNGMMFAILGIHEYMQYTRDPDAEYLFTQGVLALKENLARYHKDGYSSYDILGNPPGNSYHALHVRLLDQLYTITGEDRFREYRDRWRAGQDPVMAVWEKNSSGLVRVAFAGGLFYLFLILGFLALVTLRIIRWSRTHYHHNGQGNQS